MHPTVKMPLFVITGASGVGKTTICERLFRDEKDYIVLDSDLLWHERYNKPEEKYREFRTLWLSLCANIAQIGLPVALCGCAMPEQFENCENRDLVGDIHYLAVVCDDETLQKRMRQERGIRDKAWIESSLAFNRWLREHGGQTCPPITVLNTTNSTPDDAAAVVDRWIRGRLT